VRRSAVQPQHACKAEQRRSALQALWHCKQYKHVGTTRLGLLAGQYRTCAYWLFLTTHDVPSSQHCRLCVRSSALPAPQHASHFLAHSSLSQDVSSGFRRRVSGIASQSTTVPSQTASAMLLFARSSVRHCAYFAFCTACGARRESALRLPRRRQGVHR
jgi:hypothetical protein